MPLDPFVDDPARKIQVVEGAFAIAQTGERRLYGNIFLKEAVIAP